MKWLALLALIITILAVIIFSFISKKDNQTINSIKTEPEREVYLGAWVGDFWNNDKKALNTQVLKEFESNIGSKVAIANIYSEWSYLNNKDLIKNLENISVNGWTPMISANPFFFTDCPENNESVYKTIANGDCDDFLREAARNLKSYKKPIFLRFAWEMNLPNMYWSIEKTQSTPKDFINAWRKLYKIFDEENAQNIIWVLSFNTTNSNSVPYKELYPGDEYVDWVAIDGYNWGNSHDWSGWANFNGVFRNSYNEITDITTEKPIMLSEVNSAPNGGDKAKWLDDMLTLQVPENFPLIEAIVFFNENKTEGESVDWRMEKSEKYLDVLKKTLKNKMYRTSYP